ELPTMENLYKRDKKKYKNDTGRRCLKNVETNDHWTECRDNEVSKDKLIYRTVSKILTKANNFSERNAVELTGILKENKDKRNNKIKPLAGIITKEVEQEINAFGKGFKGKKSFCCLILHKINNNLHKQMWKHRCIYTTAITNDLILEKTGDEVQEEVKTDRRKEVMERVNRKSSNITGRLESWVDNILCDYIETE
ncbi:21753_t:CDS:2, partial [Gigaspora rosea]